MDRRMDVSGAGAGPEFSGFHSKYRIPRQTPPAFKPVPDRTKGYRFNPLRVTWIGVDNAGCYTALGMVISLGGRYKNIGEQLKVLRNKGNGFSLMLPVRF
jgi:hypothetical protein